ncbi:MAG: HAD family phosphatase [Candidatus Riflebacteria bacterium]|nr:HAD family phosphatase [Candidatus Riflebacteria bacterium]
MVIFDMDGVLIDSEPWYFEVNRRFFAERGIAITRADFECYAGMGMVTMWEKVRVRYRLPETAVDLAAQETEAFHRFLLSQARLDPIAGARDLLEGLSRRGVFLGLASSTPRKNVDCVLERTGLRPFFGASVAGDEVTNGKPAPDIFLQAARLGGHEPARCAVVEDSGNGVRAAKAAGMFCVGVRNPASGRQDLSPADLVVDDLGPASRDRILTDLPGVTS